MNKSFFKKKSWIDKSLIDTRKTPQKVLEFSSKYKYVKSKTII